MKNFTTRFLEGADAFIAQLDKKSASKLFYIVDLAEQTNDPKLFKKLRGEIWEFRSQYLGNQNRLLAFWDKTKKPWFLLRTDLLRKHKRFLPKKLKEPSELEKNILKKRIINNHGN